MSLAEQVGYLVAHARHYHQSEIPIDVETLAALQRAASQRDRLLAYARHVPACISTLPCSCGLDALLHEVAP